MRRGDASGGAGKRLRHKAESGIEKRRWRIRRRLVWVLVRVIVWRVWLNGLLRLHVGGSAGREGMGDEGRRVKKSMRRRGVGGLQLRLSTVRLACGRRRKRDEAAGR